MEKIQCLNCKQMIELKEIVAGCQATCECGCIQKCLDKDKYISRWRVMNPFDFKDKRANKNIIL